jgi:23S rRNA (cytidine1920-2'-O)/16S rRNA (cytidine1409-2'-O)-methyltransferase
MSDGRRRRLDADLVRRGLAENRQRAQAAITEGRVLVGGAVAERPSRLVAPGEPVEVVGPGPRFVGRGGEKLDAALDHFGMEVGGIVALDAGASTGGFTDCLLQRGARLVVAVDVGHGQLDPRLREDSRVVVLERTHVKDLVAGSVAEALSEGTLPVDVVTADLSFISLASVAHVLAGPIVRPHGELLLLVKPQFEVGREAATRGRGVIREPELWLDALRSVGSSLEAAGAVIIGAVRSTLTGASGNTEFFVRGRAHEATVAPRADRAEQAVPPRPRNELLENAGIGPLSERALRILSDAVQAATR